MAHLAIREGLLDRLKELRGISTDEAMARIGGVSLATYRRYRDGSAPSAEFLANIGLAFGLSIGEIAVITPSK